MLRNSECIRLPSQRTLRDYTHYTSTTIGFSAEVNKQLRERSISVKTATGTCTAFIYLYTVQTRVYIVLFIHVCVYFLLFQYNCCVYMFTVVVPDMCHW